MVMTVYVLHWGMLWHYSQTSEWENKTSLRQTVPFYSIKSYNLVIAYNTFSCKLTSVEI
jgi:hypothetical protein